jgi:hypothetical protein
MDPGMRGVGEQRLFSFVRVIITAALCQHKAQFTLWKRISLGRAKPSNQHCTASKLHHYYVLVFVYATPLLKNYQIWNGFTFFPYVNVGVIFRWIINAVVCHGNLSYFILGLFPLNGSSSVYIRILMSYHQLVSVSKSLGWSLLRSIF